MRYWMVTIALLLGIPFMTHAASYEARILTVTPQSIITVAPDASFTVRVKIKNTGSMMWGTRGTRYVSLYAGDAATRQWRHKFWSSAEQPARLRTTVKPGGDATLAFALHAPPAVGTYALRFRLAAEDTAWIKGGEVTLTMIVAVPNPSSLRAERSNLDGIAALPLDTLGVARNDNVLMRVAIDQPPGDVWISATDTYRIESAGKVLATVSAWQPTRAWFREQYHVIANGAELTSNEPLRFTGTDQKTLMIAAHLDRRPAWNPALNDNRFSGTLEYVSNPLKKMWLVNELPLEQYLEGIAEVSNGVPIEYAKAMAVAARTYALYYTTRGGKHANEPFTLKASVDELGDDQVYRGFGFTERALASNGTNFVEAVRATKGEMIYYNNAPILAAYSSDSGGQTKDARRVWGPSFVSHPYLWGVNAAGQPILDPPNTVRRSTSLQAASHGVGISAAGAEQIARNGATYKDILAHYYPGTTVK